MCDGPSSGPAAVPTSPVSVVSRTEKYVPRHRAPGKHKRKRAPLAALRSSGALTGLAVVATGVVVAGGVTAGGTGGDTSTAPAPAPAQAAAAAATSDVLADRGDTVSRSDRRGDRVAAKARALGDTTGVVTTHERKLSDSDPRDIARALLGEYGFASSEFGCLDNLWTRESNWRWDAANPTSSAYGIPQSLPGSKMAAEGDDWRTNPVTQIRWGLGYISGRYGTPCNAWGHSERVGWY